MKKKDLGLILSLALLVYLAVASEKMILVAEGYAVSRGVLEIGRDVYVDHCDSCHGGDGGGAPRIGDEKEWEIRAGGGMNPLISHVTVEHRRRNFLPAPGSSDLDNEKIASAVAYLVRASGKNR